jgi:hypothetical protein
MNLKYALRTMLSTLCNVWVKFIDRSSTDTSGSELKGDHP